MKRRAVGFQTVMALLLLAFPAWASSELAIRIVENTVVDGEALVVNVEIRNISPHTMNLDLSPNHGIRVGIRPLRVDTHPCVVTSTGIIQSLKSFQRLTDVRSGDGVTIPVDLRARWPLGLRPGEYRVTPWYQDDSTRVVGMPSTLQIVAPTGDQEGPYQDFLELCRSIMKHEAGSPERVLTFAKTYPEFGLRDDLLRLASSDARPETRLELNELLLSSERFGGYARSQAERANRDLDAAKRRAAYDEAYRAAVSNEDPQLVKEFHSLTTIVDPSAFEMHERFVRDHPHSFFAPAALHRMVVAVEDGVVPPRFRADQAEQALAELYGRILDRYPDSYFAGEVRASERAKRLLERREH